MRKREACCGREQFPVRYNKAVRASSIRRRMELRRLVRSSAREPEGGSDWPPSNRGPPKIVSGGISGIFGYSATVGRTTFLRTICHTRLSYRCVGAGTSHPCRSRVSAASMALCLFRMDPGPWLEMSRLLMVSLGQCCISQSRSCWAGSFFAGSGLGDVGRPRFSRSKIVTAAIRRSRCDRPRSVSGYWAAPPLRSLERLSDPLRPSLRTGQFG